MQFGVVIASVDREPALRRLLDALARQDLPAVQVVVCVPERSALSPELLARGDVEVVDGVRGASAQRNHALRSLSAGLDLVVFFDDDALPRRDYLAKAAAVFSDPQVVAMTGRVERDGAAEKRELGVEEMEQALAASWSREPMAPTEVDQLYGCNMVVRAALARELGFDERLPLYSWLEDLDFARRLRRRGRLVKDESAVCVHQGSDSGGRRQHRRLGYSQVSNYLYLASKGTASARDGISLVGRPVLASLAGAVHGDQRSARRERLVGMGLALADLARGRITPERITRL